MRMSSLFVPTRKEDPADAEVASHKLLIRAGYIRMVARGIYSFLPLGWRSVRKIEQIVREEMDRAGAQELLMPGVQPAELWEESGRWQEYGSELLRFKDRKGANFCLGPTHEEVITDIVRQDVSSYKQLPINLYQIQTKFRDEPRPRFGLMRGREFIMKDAYSFDLTKEDAQKSYERMFAAYTRIFTRFGFEFRAVEADTGNIGGDRSHEFQVLADTGEDTIAVCPTSGYAANVEKAEILLETSAKEETVELQELTQVQTPGVRSVAEVASFFGVAPTKIVKTLIYLADQTPVAVCMRGDHSVNEVKLKSCLEQALGLEFADLTLAPDEVTSSLTKAPVGFAGPVGLGLPVVADLSVQGMRNVIVGANAKDLHHTNANIPRDFAPTAFADLRLAQPGDRCARSGELYEFVKGIEVGHIFYLGTKYSKALGAQLQDEHGDLRPLEMGCYGCGITRVLAAAVEQGHDDDGMILPMAIAPYHVTILPLQMKDEEVVQIAQDLYASCLEAGLEVILDDRDQRAGAKFKDADLIGIPLRVAIGSRGLKEGVVELKRRGGDQVESIAIDQLLGHLQAQIKDALGGA